MGIYSPVVHEYVPPRYIGAEAIPAGLHRLTAGSDGQDVAGLIASLDTVQGIS
jgi:hypothetical protein